MRNWLKSLIADAVGQALATQHAATVKTPVYNITATDPIDAYANAERAQRAHVMANGGKANW